MAYDDLTANPNLEANIMVVCESVLEISKDGSTKIEQWYTILTLIPSRDQDK